MRVIGRLGIAQSVDIFLVVGTVARPLAEVRCPVGVAQIAEDGIGLEPFLVGLEEGAEVFGCQHSFAFLGEDQAKIFPLGFVDGFVVDGGQGIQFLASLFELLHFLAVVQGTQLSQVGVHGVEGVDGDAAVGIRVGP